MYIIIFLAFLGLVVVAVSVVEGAKDGYGAICGAIFGLSFIVFTGVVMLGLYLAGVV